MNAPTATSSSTTSARTTNPTSPWWSTSPCTSPPGQTVGIVGAPGSGKSTLIRLLMRLYPVNDGRILIDGTDIRDVDGQWLRHQIGVVMQDPFLYSRSIAENLRVARPDADKAHLVEVAQEAAIHDAIAEFPAGYEAPVGERGITLSGGQRQRLALARALLKGSARPRARRLALGRRHEHGTTPSSTPSRSGVAGHTTIVIAHRLSSVKDTDRILVLADGRLVQDGSHAALANTPGPYQRLCEIQGCARREHPRGPRRCAGLAKPIGVRRLRR